MMILKNNEEEHVIRVLLDYRATILLLNKSWAQHRKISTFQKNEPKVVGNFVGKIEPDIGLVYTYPLRLQHQKHFSVDSFEIQPIDDQCDAILPFWWISKHAPLNLLDEPEDVQFVQCRNCTEATANEFSLQLDLEITEYPEAMVIGSISVQDKKLL
jgi:hypothetical protein